MADMNFVVLSGRVTSDVGMSIFQSGVRITEFRLDVTGRFQDDSGDDTDLTVPVVVEARMELARFCEYYVEEGICVMVSGRLRPEPPIDGGFLQLFVEADSVELLHKLSTSGKSSPEIPLADKGNTLNNPARLRQQR